MRQTCPRVCWYHWKCFLKRFCNQHGSRNKAFSMLGCGTNASDLSSSSQRMSNLHASKGHCRPVLFLTSSWVFGADVCDTNVHFDANVSSINAPQCSFSFTFTERMSKNKLFWEDSLLFIYLKKLPWQLDFFLWFPVFSLFHITFLGKLISCWLHKNVFLCCCPVHRTAAMFGA